MITVGEAGSSTPLVMKAGREILKYLNNTDLFNESDDVFREASSQESIFLKGNEIRYMKLKKALRESRF